MECDRVILMRHRCPGNEASGSSCAGPTSHLLQLGSANLAQVRAASGVIEGNGRSACMPESLGTSEAAALRIAKRFEHHSCSSEAPHIHAADSWSRVSTEPCSRTEVNTLPCQEKSGRVRDRGSRTHAPGPSAQHLRACSGLCATWMHLI